MHKVPRFALATLILALPACDSSPDPAAPDREGVLAGHTLGVTASSSGGGHFDAGVDVVFAYTAVQTSASGAATGHARHSTAVGGEAIEFLTTVTCMTVDAVNGRAWIGGIVAQNNSTHPAFTGAINQPGRDIWFRVVDYGEGAGASQPDRSTFVGFEGSAGIITSEEYCATQPWPDNDARTSPVTQGDLQVRD